MIQFHCTRSAREVILRVSTSALDRAVAATDPVAYAGVNLDKVALLAAAEARLRAPQVDVFEGCLGFINGRHRARAALWQGRKVFRSWWTETTPLKCERSCPGFGDALL